MCPQDNYIQQHNLIYQQYVKMQIICIGNKSNENGYLVPNFEWTIQIGFKDDPLHCRIKQGQKAPDKTSSSLKIVHISTEAQVVDSEKSRFIFFQLYIYRNLLIQLMSKKRFNVPCLTWQWNYYIPHFMICQMQLKQFNQ